MSRNKGRLYNNYSDQTLHASQTPQGHASVPQVTLMLALFGERDWSECGDNERVQRVEQIHEAGMEVWVKKDFHKPQGVVLNEALTGKNYMPVSRREATELITWLKTLKTVDVYE